MGLLQLRGLGFELRLRDRFFRTGLGLGGFASARFRLFVRAGFGFGASARFGLFAGAGFRFRTGRGLGRLAGAGFRFGAGLGLGGFARLAFGLDTRGFFTRALFGFRLGTSGGLGLDARGFFAGALCGFLLCACRFGGALGGFLARALGGFLLDAGGLCLCGLLGSGRIRRRREIRGDVGRGGGLPGVHLLAESSRNLQREISEARVVRVARKGGAEQLKPLGESTGLDVRVRVAERLGLDARLRFFALSNELLDLLDPAPECLVRGAELQQHAERPVGGAQVSSTKLFECLLLQRLLIH